MVKPLMEYTSIRVRRETRELLQKTLIDLEARLGRRLDYDDVIRILAQRARGKPELLMLLTQNPVKENDTDKAQRLLRRERERDTRL